MNLETIMARAATRVETTGLRCHDKVPATLHPPCAFIALGEGEWDDLGQGVHFILKVMLVHGSQSVDTAQASLWAYLNPTGTKSIRAAFEADPDLSSTVHSSRMTGWGELEFIEVAGASHLAQPVLIDVLA